MGIATPVHLRLFLVPLRRLASSSSSSSPSSSSPSKQPGLPSSHEYIDVQNQEQWPAELLEQFLGDCSVQAEFVTNEEEAQLLLEIEPHMRRMRWEEEHWDQQIHLYREREQRDWSGANQRVIDRVWAASFPDPSKRSPYVHLLDLHADGFIRPHLDEARYCGAVISGLSLLSPSVMRLRHFEQQWAGICWADLLLPRRSLYRLSGFARFKFTHEILANQNSSFRGKPVPRQRRISLICREFPERQTVASEGVPPLMRSIPSTTQQ